MCIIPCELHPSAPAHILARVGAGDLQERGMSTFVPPHSMIQDAKRCARELEKFEYRKKVRTATTMTRNNSSDNSEDGGVANDEVMAQAQAWVDGLRSLPKEVCTASTR